MQQLAENLWFLRYELKLLGADLHRNVTVIRLATGQLVIHSTGPFTAADVEAINSLGQPSWLVDAMLRHDTFAEEGRAAFPNATYLAPAGFSDEIPTLSILPAPTEWSGEVEVLEIEGAPSFAEHVFFHRASRTLVVADLVFNFDSDEPFWTEVMLQVAVGRKHFPGMTRLFKAAIKDEAAFQRSMAEMLRWDFDRVIVGHGDVIESGGKAKVLTMLGNAGFADFA